MLQGRDIITHNHFTALFWDHLGELVPEEILLDVVYGKIIEADIPAIRVGSSPSALISDPPSSPHFYAGCPSCRNPPTLSWLGTGTKYIGLHTQWHG